MNAFSLRGSLLIDHATSREEASRGLVRLFWHYVRYFLEEYYIGR